MRETEITTEQFEEEEEDLKRKRRRRREKEVWKSAPLLNQVILTKRPIWPGSKKRSCHPCWETNIQTRRNKARLGIDVQQIARQGRKGNRNYPVAYRGKTKEGSTAWWKCSRNWGLDLD